ncbi:hypothetical protein C8R46DRAFT_1214688 [Mycena filopes]|nr:hypothetical protein C8R46DRAFT_1214688 [Mycena filopes]
MSKINSTSPRKKTISEWKRTRDDPRAPTPEPQLPHAPDLLRNRAPDASLGPFDGKVGAIVECNGDHYFITTNTDYIPTLPSIQTPHKVYLRSDMRYGTDDPTLWPQQWTEQFCHMPLIAKKGSRPELAAMWWDPSRRDFLSGSAVMRGLGRLHFRRLSPIIAVVDEVVQRCQTVREKSPLIGELIQHILMWLEQLQTLPTTFPKMVFALTSLQREVLELDALHEYITVYKSRMSTYVPGAGVPVVAQSVGAFTTVPSVAQQLWWAGIPFWLLRPTFTFDTENILEVVPLTEPVFDLPDPDELGAGAPPVLYSGNSTLQKIDAIHRAALYTPWYHDPFETGFDRAASPSPTPVASTSTNPIAPPPPTQSLQRSLQQQHQPRYRPYGGASNKPPAAERGPQNNHDRDKFVLSQEPEMPPAIVCMTNALAKVNRAVLPYAHSGKDIRYVLPEPALFANIDPRRRAKWLHHWTLVRDAFFFMLTQSPRLFAPQQWRDILEGRIVPEGNKKDSREYRRRQEVQDALRPALDASNVDRIQGFPVPAASVPEFTLEATREIIWQVAETSFRFEFCALDRRASRQERAARVRACFAGHMIVGTPLEFSQRGWASSTLEERHRYVRRTAELMLDWRTKSQCPSIIRRVEDRHPWSTAQVEELEVAVCEYYTQAFWEHFGRAAVIPMRLDHELKKDEGQEEKGEEEMEEGEL